MVWDFEQLRELQAYIIQQLWLGLNKQENCCQIITLSETIPEVGELDELETFVKSKKIRFGCGRQ